jgi:hypothetical protein
MTSNVLRRSLLPFILLLIAIILLLTQKAAAQTDTSKYTITDLRSGDPVELYYDTAVWKSMNRTTNQPVEYYVIHYTDPSKKADTVHGITGLIVNGLVWKNDAGNWQMNNARLKWDGNELKIKDRYGRVIKWEKGELKIKDWNSKFKNDKGDAKYIEEWEIIKWKDNQIVKPTLTGKN